LGALWKVTEDLGEVTAEPSIMEKRSVASMEVEVSVEMVAFTFTLVAAVVTTWWLTRRHFMKSVPHGYEVRHEVVHLNREQVPMQMPPIAGQMPPIAGNIVHSLDVNGVANTILPDSVFKAPQGRVMHYFFNCDTFQGRPKPDLTKISVCRRCMAWQREYVEDEIEYAARQVADDVTKQIMDRDAV